MESLILRLVRRDRWWARTLTSLDPATGLVVCSGFVYWIVLCWSVMWLGCAADLSGVAYSSSEECIESGGGVV